MATRVAKPQYQHRFEFVPLGGEREVQKRTRSHIQSESSRKRAWRRLQKLNSSKVAPPKLQWVVREPTAVVVAEKQPSPPTQQVSRPAKHPKLTVKTRPSLPSIDPDLLVDRECLRSVGSESPPRRHERLFPLALQTRLGVQRIDPFDSLPCKGSYESQRLLHHWATDYSRLSWTYVPVGETEHYRQIILNHALSHPATMEALLTKCARHLALLDGEDPRKSKIANAHKVELIKQVMSALCSGGRQPLTADILVAIVAMVDQEYRWGSPELGESHASGFRNIVQSMGGPETLPVNQLLGTNLLLVEQALPSTSASFLFNDSDLDARCQEFISLFDDFDPVLLQNKLDPTYSPGPFTWHDVRRVIQPGSTMYRLLQEPEVKLVNPTPEELRLQRFRAYCRMECMFYLMIPLRVVRDAPADATLFIQRLQMRIVEIGFRAEDNVEMLSFSLTKGQWRQGCLYGRPERAWKVTRLMSIVKRLSDDTAASVRTVLRRFLMPDKNGCLDPNPFYDFDPARVQAEILGG